MISAFLLFLAWGSYLNSLGYRLLNIKYFYKARSFCPSCLGRIHWYDNIPIISWLLLSGRCRNCQKQISWLYPFIEILTPCILLVLWTAIPLYYFPAYFIFFSALILTIRTDFDQMLISRFTTLYLIPIAFTSAAINRIPLSLSTAIVGSIFGYFLLWIAKKISFKVNGKEGIGQGDLELLAFIGAFSGPLGCWIALLIGSIMGTFISLISMAITKKSIVKIPFGAYLAFGSIIYIVFQDFFILYFFNI